MPAEESAEDIAERKARMEKVLENGIIPVSKYEPAPHVEDVCAICIDKLRSGEEIRTLLCNHIFHTECIDPWLYSKPLCPLCKDNVLERSEAVGDSSDGHCHSETDGEGKLSRQAVGNGNTVGLVEISPVTHRSGKRSDVLVTVGADAPPMYAVPATPEMSAAEATALQKPPSNSLLHHMASDLDARMLRSGTSRRSNHSIYLPEINSSHMAPSISGSTLGPPMAVHARGPSGGPSVSSLASSAFAPDQRHGTQWRDDGDDTADATMLVPAMSEHDDDDTADHALCLRAVDAGDVEHTIIDVEGVNVFVNEECLRQLSHRQQHGGQKRKGKKKHGRRRQQSDIVDIVTNETAFATDLQRYPSVSSISNTSVV